tara:strand:+ start:490 stop:669 length:180 start_codon:yes stop_codon:yes gene_type:complete
MSESQCPRCNESGIIVYFKDPNDDDKTDRVVVPWVLVETMIGNYLDKTIDEMIDVGSLE